MPTCSSCRRARIWQTMSTLIEGSRSPAMQRGSVTRPCPRRCFGVRLKDGRRSREFSLRMGPYAASQSRNRRIVLGRDEMAFAWQQLFEVHPRLAFAPSAINRRCSRDPAAVDRSFGGLAQEINKVPWVKRSYGLEFFSEFDAVVSGTEGSARLTSEELGSTTLGSDAALSTEGSCDVCLGV